MAEGTKTGTATGATIVVSRRIATVTHDHFMMLFGRRASEHGSESGSGVDAAELWVAGRMISVDIAVTTSSVESARVQLTNTDLRQLKLDAPIR
jgi:hypothetical protein